MNNSVENVVVHRGKRATNNGLQFYIMKVYNFMMLGLVISGAVAYITSHYAPLTRIVFQTNFFWFVILAPFITVIALGSFASRLSAKATLFAFILYSALMGLFLSSIFLVYTSRDILSVFLVTLALFGCMSFYGYFSKKDLTSTGSFFRMGLFGLILALVVNLFMRNPILDYILSIVAVFVFTGLTAYDVNRIKLSYSEQDENSVMVKKAVFGALSLYMNFINIFLHLLRLFKK